MKITKRTNLEAISEMVLEKFKWNYLSLLPRLGYVDDRMSAFVGMEQAMFDKAMEITINDMQKTYDILNPTTKKENNEQ